MKTVGRSPMAMIATSFLTVPVVSVLTNAGSAVRMCEMSSRAPWLVSTRMAICMGSTAGSTLRTSRAMLSSRTTKSEGPRSGIGAPASVSALTYMAR